jgi:hypothetical protein
MLFIKGDPKDQTNLLIARAKGGNNSIAAPAAVGSVLSHDSSQSASQPPSFPFENYAPTQPHQFFYCFGYTANRLCVSGLHETKQAATASSYCD